MTIIVMIVCSCLNCYWKAKQFYFFSQFVELQKYKNANSFHDFMSECGDVHIEIMQTIMKFYPNNYEHSIDLNPTKHLYHDLSCVFLTCMSVC